MRIINSALHQVSRQGTARSLRWRLPESLKVVGKTGTTNDTRDSWFAGFSGEHLIVTWLGTDNNQSIGLTGSSGALPIWADIMKKSEPGLFLLPMMRILNIIMSKKAKVF